MEMTYTEMREQILANAMRLFPKVVEDYLAKHRVSRAKPEDIFNINTVRAGINGFENGCNFAWIPSGYINAHLSYHPWGSLTQSDTAISAPAERSSHEAVCQLLTATDHALGIFVEREEAWDQYKIKDAADAGGYMVNSHLLLQGLAGVKDATTQL